ncbi:hypothetical protein [Mycobacteroides abscessus]|uniref:hypothetical protein n=1 Tax=Mycobacteroides abscessus TaxID=36809 RepID=UPI0009A71E0B|nr:hypothetical protein [Mycobacteroides abscessus]
MSEIGPDDLPAATRARFADDDAAQAAIDAVLASARRWCGWHVSPVQTDVEMDMDGPGGHVLSLPTLNLISVSEVTERGVPLDVSTLDKSRRKGTITKPFGCWTHRDGAIVATVTHGYTEAEAADWRQAIVDVVGTRSLAQITTRDSGDMKRKRIDDVEYEWFESLVSTDHELAAKFSAFRILQSP